MDEAKDPKILRNGIQSEWTRLLFYTAELTF